MSPNTLDHQDAALVLGKAVDYPKRYDPELLHPIARAPGRGAVGLLQGSTLPFDGWDMWRAYELSWLNNRGLPQVSLLKLWVPASSPFIIESKSLKLYLNSLNQERHASTDALHQRLTQDLTQCAGAPVHAHIITPEHLHLERIEEPEEICLDQLDIEINCYEPDAHLLNCSESQEVSESVFSRLLKSNCPVTGQPDWASVHISYTGSAIDHASLLRYIVSYRDHEGFHEQCVEQIFCDIMDRCQPKTLSVHARYTRRGGIDINPWRATPGHIQPILSRSALQ